MKSSLPRIPHTQVSDCLACVASISALVRRESWDESSNFRAITRLETLATRATDCPYKS